MNTLDPYIAMEFDLRDLKGISNETLDLHIGLYKGYVKQANLLQQQLHDVSDSEKQNSEN